jgi:hypothetical protein
MLVPLDHGADEKRERTRQSGWRLNIYGWTGRDVVSQLTFMLRRPKRLERAQRQEENLSGGRHGGRLGGGREQERASRGRIVRDPF